MEENVFCNNAGILTRTMGLKQHCIGVISGAGEEIKYDSGNLVDVVD